MACRVLPGPTKALVAKNCRNASTTIRPRSPFKLSVRASATATSPDIVDTAYPGLKAVSGVYHVSSQQEQLHNEVRPALDAAGVQLLLTSIGTKERGLEFCERTGFDPARLLADPDNKIYDVLGMKRGLTETFFSPETPKAIWEDIKTGRIETLKGVMKVWTKQKLWTPPKQEQALNQGGVVIFDGQKAIWVWRDPATGAHADMQEVIKIATQGL